MLFLDLFAAIMVSILMTWLFYLATGGKRRRKVGLFWVLVILIFTTWAGGVWIKPTGPAWWGLHWLPFILTGAIVNLILIITVPRKPPKGRHETLDMLEDIEREREVEEAAYFTLSIFFWVLVILLLLAIIFRYLIRI